VSNFVSNFVSKVKLKLDTTLGHGFPAQKRVQLDMHLDTKSPGSPGESVSKRFRRVDTHLDKVFRPTVAVPLSLERGDSVETRFLDLRREAG
jgi:hypothetical protein